MTVEVYLMYLATLLVFFAHPPGPSQVLFMAGAVRHGTGPALPILAGDLSANAIQIAVAGFGLAGLVAASAGLFVALKWAGVVYLVWIGIGLIHRTRSTLRPDAPDRRALYRQGFVTSAANPYAVVFFAALFPQFIDAASPLAPQVGILGVTYLVVDGAILILLGATASRAFAFLGSSVERWLGAISGTGLIVAAALLALRGVPEDVRG